MIALANHLTKLPIHIDGSLCTAQNAVAHKPRPRPTSMLRAENQWIVLRRHHCTIGSTPNIPLTRCLYAPTSRVGISPAIASGCSRDFTANDA